ncbi:MAG TPA: HXXEE domain-containing protein [Pyrinomonadaceae bacterium]
MNERAIKHASRLLLFAPLIFVCHFLEEAPGFVQWFNGHVSRGITSGLFWRVNFSALAITLIVVGIVWFSRTAFAFALAIVWFGFLMLANAVLHIVGGLADGRYVPGLATAILLYLPYYCWFFKTVAESRLVKVTVLVAGALAGSLPMLIHGYLIIFRGSRLF